MANSGIAPIHLRYRTASTVAQKWECIGGGLMVARLADFTPTLQNTWQILASGLYAPAGGVYEITYGAQMIAATAGNAEGYQTVALDNTIVAALGQGLRWYRSSSTQGDVAGVSDIAWVTATSGQQFNLSAHTVSALNSIQWQRPWLRVTPIRLG